MFYHWRTDVDRDALEGDTARFFGWAVESGMVREASEEDWAGKIREAIAAAGLE